MRKIPVAARDVLKSQSVRLAPSALSEFKTCTHLVYGKSIELVHEYITNYC